MVDKLGVGWTYSVLTLKTRAQQKAGISCSQTQAGSGGHTMPLSLYGAIHCMWPSINCRTTNSARFFSHDSCLDKTHLQICYKSTHSDAIKVTFSSARAVHLNAGPFFLIFSCGFSMQLSHPSPPRLSPSIVTPLLLSLHTACQPYTDYQPFVGATTAP